jgi:hypothetical protein
MKSTLTSLLLSITWILSGQGAIKWPTDVTEEYNKLPAGIGYNQLVKPILSDKCFKCHGNDVNQRKAGLRLDVSEAAYADLPQSPGKQAIRPKVLDQSEVYHRILSADPEYQMPDPQSHLELTAKEKAILIKWIEEGALYQTHWAFVQPVKVTVPEIKLKDWAYNPIDRFIASRLELENVLPSKEGSRDLLLRRLSFDLTGLPPSLAELQAFAVDQSPDAYEKQVDRLLASPHYGERMAVDWLDLARFADSHGYTVDRLRNMAPYRDWVINAFNQNMPYSTFIEQQLAGDLMPQPTREMKIATAFNRLHPQNMEGGIIEKEFQTEYVIDRTNTFGQTFLGLSLGCARCHDHKFDPISQKNYYELFSFFNHVEEAGQIAWNDDLPTPTLLLPTPEQEKILEYINKSIAVQESKLSDCIAGSEAQFETWLKNQQYQDLVNQHIPAKGLMGYYPFENSLANAQSPYLAAKMHRETDTTTEKPVFEKVANGNSVLVLDGDGYLDLKDVGIFRKSEPFTISAKIRIPKKLEEGVIFHKCIAERLYNFKGYALTLRDNKLEISMAHTAPSNAITRMTQDAVPKDRWITVTMSYDGSSKAEGFKLFIDGSEARMVTRMDQLYKDILFFNKDEPGLQVGGWWRGLGFKNGRVDDLIIYNRVLTDFEINVIANKVSWNEIVQKKLAGLTVTDRSILKDYFIANEDEQTGLERNLLKKLRTELADSAEHIDEIMVMQEMNPPRKSHVLIRGNYDAPGKEVEPCTPPAVLAFDERFKGNRLGLAQWLIDERNPLTARVEVNRIWQALFGIGIVKTSEDFGNQGQMPSHPELLDWLALDFIQSGWDIKRLIKSIVMSATYRQDSKSSAVLDEIDPENRLMARGPALRLTAEMLRDQALSASGLINLKLGGKSIKPYQPVGLWEINSANYIPDSTDDLYRRSLYVLIKRSVPNPTLGTFDAPDRSYCLARRQKTNTPLQALVTLNDPTYTEASKVLGEQMASVNNKKMAIETAYRKLTSTYPNEKELQLLMTIQSEEYEKFKSNPGRKSGWLHAGKYKVNTSLDQDEVAANSVVANIILNSDASLLKR